MLVHRKKGPAIIVLRRWFLLLDTDCTDYTDSKNKLTVKSVKSVSKNNKNGETKCWFTEKKGPAIRYRCRLHP